MFKPFLSKIMTEAHARAKEDYAFDANNRKPYSYYLGLQMRNGYAEARTALGIAQPGFQVHGENRWY